MTATLAAPAREAIDAVVALALAEDLAGGIDVTTVATVPDGQRGIADLVAREDGVVAGIAVATRIFQLQSPMCEVIQRGSDGTRVRPGDVLLTVSGPTRDLLTAERTALNLICHLSGIASTTARWIAGVDGTGAEIRDTRKTMPGLRALEKYAVRCGGGVNHRMSLSDQALIKDNHIVAAGGVRAAIDAVRRLRPDIATEVECDTVAQVREAVASGATMVLLDNMSIDELSASVAIAGPAGVKTEASGGLQLDAARNVAGTGVDYLSVGALTHSARVLDIGLDLRSAR
ncbi:MAG: carboxylating nicotinate-nucleotide diphosphorylase [Mycobacteriales bacterium]